MLWLQFGESKVYPQKMCAVAMAMGLLKNNGLKMVFVYLNKIQSLDFFDHLPIVKNSLCQNSDFLRYIIHVVSELLFCQIS